MKIFILILYLGLTLEISISELPQYGSIEVKSGSNIYLNVVNYEKDEIYINVAGYGTINPGDSESHLIMHFEYFLSNSNFESDFQFNNTFKEESSFLVHML